MDDDENFYFEYGAAGEINQSAGDAKVEIATDGNMILSSGFSLAWDITPTQITADQNDYNPTDAGSGAALSTAARHVGSASGDAPSARSPPEPYAPGFVVPPPALGVLCLAGRFTDADRAQVPVPTR